MTALFHRRHGENLAKLVDVELIAYIHGAVGNLNLQNSASAADRERILNAGIKFGSVPNGESDLVRFVGDCEHIVGVVDNQLANAHIVNAHRAVLIGHFNGNPSHDIVGFFGNVFALQTELAAFEGLVDFFRIHAFAQRENAMHYRKQFGVGSSVPLCRACDGCAHDILACVRGCGCGVGAVVLILEFILYRECAVAAEVDVFGV